MNVADLLRFDSVLTNIGPLRLPSFTGLQVMVMPFVYGMPETMGERFRPWFDTIGAACSLYPAAGVGYVTIDERILSPGETHRSPGAHVDGVSRDGTIQPGGMILVSSYMACCAWSQSFDGAPSAPDGDCEHLRPQFNDAEWLMPFRAYHLTTTTVHEGVPVKSACRRQLLRINLPHHASLEPGPHPFFDEHNQNGRGGWTRNPLVAPTGIG